MECCAHCMQLARGCFRRGWFDVSGESCWFGVLGVLCWFLRVCLGEQGGGGWRGVELGHTAEPT